MTRVAVVQVASPRDEAVEDRIDRVGDIVADLRDVDLVVLPELWATGYFAFDTYARDAQPMSGPLVSVARGWASAIGAYVHLGSFLERGDDGRLHNTGVLIDPSGRVVSAYRKMHVFGNGSLEASLISAGTSPHVDETRIGAIGTAICYDLRFPELWRSLLRHGAETIVLPAAWPRSRAEHWRVLTQCRAIEEQVFVIACNGCGTQGGVELAGGSRVVTPWGEVIAECGAAEEVLTVDVSTDLVSEVRRTFPVLGDTSPFLTESDVPVGRA